MNRKVKLISAVMLAKEIDASSVEKNLIKKFGEIDLKSHLFNFSHTDYYEKEMGKYLRKYFVSFKELFPIENIYRVKIKTGKIEKKFSKKGLRCVNLDPGYIELSKLVLFSTKNYSHRIYLKKGIFAEVTLIYKDKNFNILPWTYPDYRENLAIEFFFRVRQKYKEQIKSFPQPNISDAGLERVVGLKRWEG